ncbi:MAG TPA: response regulator, partial [Isosphaeraceae bacterium]|nr:response regulator [Isosphaeraceae bacterium]
MNSQAPLRVVLVDDHENDRYLVARELARQFPAVQVIEVVDETGLAHVLAAGAFDLLITDYVLHWSDGLRVLREVKARYSHCPVIMFTNSGNENVAVEAMKAGLDDYVLKSSKHFVRLALAARSALDRGQTRRRAAELEGRLQALVGRLNVGVYRATLDGRLVECNPALSHLLGLPSPDAAHTVNLNELFLKLEERAAMVEQLRRDGQLPRRDVA